MTAEREQDQGRPPGHRRKGRPSPATKALLDRYQESLRRELDDVLTLVMPSKWHLGRGAKRPPLAERERLWKLAIMVAKELGSEIDTPAKGGTVTPIKPRGPSEF